MTDKEMVNAVDSAVHRQFDQGLQFTPLNKYEQATSSGQTIDEGPARGSTFVRLSKGTFRRRLKEMNELRNSNHCTDPTKDSDFEPMEHPKIKSLLEDVKAIRDLHLDLVINVYSTVPWVFKEGTTEEDPESGALRRAFGKDFSAADGHLARFAHRFYDLEFLQDQLDRLGRVTNDFNWKVNWVTRQLLHQAIDLENLDLCFRTIQSRIEAARLQSPTSEDPEPDEETKLLFDSWWEAISAAGMESGEYLRYLQYLREN